MKAPDYFAPFLGWKGLIARPDGLLHSPRGDAWPTREKFAAECKGGDHTPPFARCSCGIYAVTSFEALAKNHYNWSEVGTVGDDRWPDGTWVIAEVDLWGGVRRGMIGYRAQYAYIRTVYVPAHKWKLGRVVRDRYDCGLAFIDRFTGERS